MGYWFIGKISLDMEANKCATSFKSFPAKEGIFYMSIIPSFTRNYWDVTLRVIIAYFIWLRTKYVFHVFIVSLKFSGFIG